MENIDFENIDAQDILQKIDSGNIDFGEVHLVYRGTLLTVDERAENMRANCKAATKQLETAQTEEALEEAREHCNEIKDSLKLMKLSIDLALKSHRSLESDER